MASFRQDFYFGREPRSRGVRLAPHAEAPARLVVHPDIGVRLEHPPLASFLTDLAQRVEVVCLEPCSSANTPAAERLSLFRDLIETIDTRWPERLPIVLLGHGLGGALALALADSERIKGAAALAPSFESNAFACETRDKISSARVPLLAVLPRGDDNSILEPLRASRQATLVTLPGDRQAALSRMIAMLVAEWSRAVVGG
jgi:pimeloyl-ACP methyl ester carboxylesterase